MSSELSRTELYKRLTSLGTYHLAPHGSLDFGTELMSRKFIGWKIFFGAKSRFRSSSEALKVLSSRGIVQNSEELSDLVEMTEKSPLVYDCLDDPKDPYRVRVRISPDVKGEVKGYTLTETRLGKPYS